MTRKWAVLAMTLLLCTECVSGCWDRREIEDRTTVLAIALDSTPDGSLQVIAYVAVPQRPESGSKGGLGVTLEGKGPTLVTALEQVQAQAKGSLSLGQLRLLLLGPALVQAGIADALAALTRHPQVRLDPFVALAPQEPLELFGLRTSEEQLAPVHISKLLESAVARQAIPECSLGKVLMENYRGESHIVLPVVAARDGKATLDGIAILRGGRLAEVLDQEQAKLYLLFAGHTPGPITIKINTDGFNICTIKPVRNRVRVQPHAITYEIQGDLLEGRAVPEKLVAEELESLMSRITPARGLEVRVGFSWRRVAP